LLDLTPLLTKSIEWAYEQEYRLIRPLSQANDIVKAGEENIHLFDIPLAAIREVVFGVRAARELRQSVEEQLATDSGIRLFSAALSTTHYSISVKPTRRKHALQQTGAAFTAGATTPPPVRPPRRRRARR
jgi:hypothetical protein